MTTRECAMVLAGLCLATIARGELDTLTSRGVTYRFASVNSTYQVVPTRDTTSRPSRDESLARCDELVAAILARATAGGRPEKFVRDRIVPLPGGKSWVDYSQRHQGYRVAGVGARVNLDEEGRIDLMGLQYETEAFPTFKPQNPTALRRKAARAVPHWIRGRPLEEILMIDPNGEAPARLVYLVVFPVRARGMDGGWQVDVDAVTGQVLRSETTFRQVTEAQP